MGRHSHSMDDLATDQDKEPLVEVSVPGGGVGFRYGMPVSPPPEQVALGIFKEMQVHCTWIAPLIEAAVTAHLHSYPKEAKFLTPWGNDAAAEYTNEEKHRAYLAHIRASLNEVGWGFLFPLLDSAGAFASVEPGGFSVCSQRHLGVYWDIPPLVQITRLVPWVEDGETPQ